MALKAVLASKEEVEKLPEAHRTLYVERDGKFLLDAEGVEDVSGLKSALEKERTARGTVEKELRATAEKFKDIDPEKARDALKQLEKLGDKKMIDEGRVDELLLERTKRMQDDWTAKENGYQKQVKDTSTERDTLRHQLHRVTIDGTFRDVALKPEVGVLPTAIPSLLLHVATAWRIDENGRPIAMNGDQIIRGSDGVKPITPEEWVIGLRTEHPYLFGQSAGGGATGKGGVPVGGKKKSQMSDKDKAAYIHDHGLDEYQKLPA